MTAFGFEQLRLRQLQLEDELSGPLVIGLELIDETASRDQFYHKLKEVLKQGSRPCNMGEHPPAKVAQRVLNEMGD